MIKWLFSPENSSAVGAYGFLFGILGLVIGFIGFGLTLYQVRQVKNSTKAAEDAISRLKIRLSHLDIVQECVAAERALEELRVAIELGHPPPVDAAHVLSMCLINIREEYRSDSELILDLDTAIEGLSRFPSAPKSRASGEVLKAKQRHTILTYFGIIRQVRSRIQKDSLL